MSYSKDFRKKVFEIKKKENLSTKEVARRSGLVYHHEVFLDGDISLILVKKGGKPATKIDMEALKEDINLNPDAYLEERASRLSVSSSCVFYALKRLKVTYKKNACSSKERRRITLCIQS